MTTTNAHATYPAAGQVTITCAVCAHPRSAHDKIALRFCNATEAGGHQRGCVCTMAPDSGTAPAAG